MNNNLVDVVPNFGIIKSVYIKEVGEKGVNNVEEKIGAILGRPGISNLRTELPMK